MVRKRIQVSLIFGLLFLGGHCNVAFSSTDDLDGSYQGAEEEGSTSSDWSQPQLNSLFPT